MTNRPSLLLLAAFSAGALFFGLALVLSLMGVDMTNVSTVIRLFALAVFLFCWVPARGWSTEWRAEVRKDAAYTQAQELTNAERAAALNPEPAAGSVVVIQDVPYTANGRPATREIEVERSAAWLSWRRALLDTLAWARRLGRIDSTAMIAAGAFGRAEDWQAVTDALQASGLLTPKTNGVRSTLAYPVEECMRRVRAGEFTQGEGVGPKVGALQAFRGFPAKQLSGEVVENS